MDFIFCIFKSFYSVILFPVAANHHRKKGTVLTLKYIDQK